MSDRELERLLWERIDGTIEAGDAARLRQLLAGDPNADRLQTEITDLAGRLDAAGVFPIPTDLGEDIRRALAAERPGPAEAPRRETQKEGRAPWFAGFGRWTGGPRPARRLAYLAAGLMVATVGYQLVTQTGPEDGPFAGTAGLTDAGSVTRPVRLELPDARGVLTISRRASSLTLDFGTEPTLGPARMLILGTGLAVEHAEQRGDATFELHASQLGVELEVEGAGGVELVVSGASGQVVTVSVEAGGENLVRHELTWEAKQGGKPSR